MSAKKRKPRVPGIHQRPSAERIEYDRFQRALLRKLEERDLPPNAQVPADLLEEVVVELYGGWTDQARKFVRILERSVGAD